MKRFFLVLLSATLLLCSTSCKQNPSTNTTTSTGDTVAVQATESSVPDWILQGNIYEVNVRQYTKEGTFNAFATHLDRLQEMGVQTLWFMPINPISKKDRKGSMGSYYAVSDYTAINPEFGTMDDWKALVQTIHGKGMKVMIDWVPNHTGADHRWLTQHPDFYVKDSLGQFVAPYDWTDVRKLNFANPVLQDSMINAMKFWLTDTGIDGFRVDHAHGVLTSFWKKCNAELKKLGNPLLLAESEDKWVNENGFDMSYPWRAYHLWVEIAAGKNNALALDSINKVLDTIISNKGIQLAFTSNHDENSWNKADYGTMPGPVHAPFAVLSFTTGRSVPLIYSGQEVPVLRPLKFFERDPINFTKFERANFYKTLLMLRRNNPALAADASFTRINVGNPKALYAFVREKAGKKVLVILNLSKTEQSIVVADKSLHGNPNNIFMGNPEPLTANPWMIEPWGYVVYAY